MSTTTGENLAADEFYAADEPPADDIPADDSDLTEAPFGWTLDKETGERRPKKSPGRPKRPPTAEEVADLPPLDRTEDRVPVPGPRPQAAEMPMPKGGVIAKGVNKVYRRAGKIVRAMDYDIGTAIIECTRRHPEDEDELTVGEAWENLCKVNPRIRAFVLGAIKGGVWWDLVMAHAPIALAIATKDAVMRFLPFGKLVDSLAEPDEDTPEGEGGLPGGMTADDVGQMGKTAADQAERIARKAARGMGMRLSEEQVRQARQMAEVMAEGHLEHGTGVEGLATVPPGFRRSQPKRNSRAGRRSR